MGTIIAIGIAVVSMLHVQLVTFSDDGSRGFSVGTDTQYCTVSLDDNGGGGIYCQSGD